MTRFTYTGITALGERTSGEIKSPDQHQAVEVLLGRGVHPVMLEARTNHPFAVNTLIRWVVDRVKVADLAVFTRQFSALLKAGMPVVQALTVLKAQTNCASLNRISGDVAEALDREGATLAAALADHPRVFDPLYTSLIRAGEESGNLQEVLTNLADHLSQASRLRRHVIGAFIYPAFLCVLGSVAVFVLMAFVIPRFQELFDSFGQELPQATRMLITVSGFLEQWWWGVLLGLMMAGGGLFALLRKPAVRIQCHRLILRSPVIGPLVLKVEMARISRTLGEMLSGGVSILVALRVTGQTATNMAIRKTFGPIIESVATGDEVAAAMGKAECFPPMMLSLVRTGERTGQLPEMLKELSAIYDDEAERAVATAVKLLEPILIVLMGGVIAGIVAAIMLPIFNANAMVQ